MKRNRRWGTTAAAHAALAACTALAACAVVAAGPLPSVAGATPTLVTAPVPSSGTHAGGAADPAPLKFRLTLHLGGGYTSYLSAPDRTATRSITFASAPGISYDVYLYPAGTPPGYLRVATGVQRSLTAGLRGRWSTSVTGAQACQAGGTLVDSGSGTSPLLASAHYYRHRYGVTLQAAPDADPFTFEGTHAGTDPCATSDPWRDWVVSFGQVRNQGAATFHVGLTVTQRQLQDAIRGQRASIAVRLRPSAGLRSSDCGSSALLGVLCHQSLGWSGHVFVSRSRR